MVKGRNLGVEERKKIKEEIIQCLKYEKKTVTWEFIKDKFRLSHHTAFLILKEMEEDNLLKLNLRMVLVKNSNLGPIYRRYREWELKKIDDYDEDEED